MNKEISSNQAPGPSIEYGFISDSNEDDKEPKMKVKKVSQGEVIEEPKNEPHNAVANDPEKDTSDSEINEENVTIFDPLNEDCLREIFSWLSSTDIKSFGATCKELHKKVAAYMSHAYQGKELKIGYEIGRFMKPNGFIKSYHNVHLIKADHTIFNFVAAKCNRKLNKIEVHICPSITNELVLCIKDQLNNVVTLGIIDNEIVGDFYSTILRHCLNLQRLIVFGFPNCLYHGTSNNWLTQKYAKLEHLTLSRRSSRNSSKIIQQSKVLPLVI